MTDSTEGYEGRPITPEMQEVFGAYGVVKGIHVQSEKIDVTYEDDSVITFVPVFYHGKQEK